MSWLKKPSHTNRRTTDTSDRGRVSIGSTLRSILAGEIEAGSIAWLDETFLYVAGSAKGAPALWQVTADGVVGLNRSSVLRQLTVKDLVAYPASTNKTKDAETLVNTDQGVYSVTTSLTEEDGLENPFFAW